MNFTLKHRLLKNVLAFGTFIVLTFGLPIVLTSCFDSKPAKEKRQSAETSATEHSHSKTVTNRLVEIEKQTGKAADEEQLYRVVKNGVVRIDAKRLTAKGSSCGTGFIVDLSKGLIVTNESVSGGLYSVSAFEITFADGTQEEAKLQYIDPYYGLAILKVDPNKIPEECLQLELCSEKLKENTKVFAMGNSEDNSFSTCQGTVFDVLSINSGSCYPKQLFQFSGLTDWKSSSAPVFCLDGKVVGILCSEDLVSGTALHSSTIGFVVNKIKQERPIKRFELEFAMDYKPIQEFTEAGVLPEEFAKAYNEQFPEAKGKILYVTEAYLDSSSDGFRGGDILVSVEDQDIGGHLDCIEDTIQAKQGAKLKFCVYRDGQKQTITVCPKVIRGLDDFALITFDGATFWEQKDTNKGAIKGVYMFSAYRSPFESLYGLVKSIDNVEIKTLDDVFKVIPKLYTKKWFQVRIFSEGAKVSEEEVHWIKHNPKFAGEARYYTYNGKICDFDIKRIANPSE